jgi:hypothetical protein
MPQIKEYTQRTDVPTGAQPRRLSGDDFGAAAGRQLQQAGEAVSDFGDKIYKRVEQDEIATATVKLSEAHLQFSNKLNDDLQKGNINEEEFAKQYDDYMAELSTQFSTRGGRSQVMRSSASMRAQFLQSAMAGKAELAGAKARQDYQTAINNFSTGLMADPSSYSMVKETTDSYIDSLVQNGGLPADKAIQLKAQSATELGKAAFRGWNDLDPNFAKQKLDSGEWDTLFDGDQKKQLYGEVDMAIRGREADMEKRRAEQERMRMERNRETQNGFLLSMDQGTLSSKAILQSDLEPKDKRTYLALLKKTAADRGKTNPTTFNTLFARIHAEDDDPNKIWDENSLTKFVGNGLSLTDLNRLRGEMQGKYSEEGKREALLKKNTINIARSKLVKKNPLTGQADPTGEASLQAYTLWLDQEFKAQRQKGKSAIELYDPNSEAWLGKHIVNYQKTPQQIMQEQLKTLKPPQPVINLPKEGSTGAAPTPSNPKARLPGETPAQYLKRMQSS